MSRTESSSKGSGLQARPGQPADAFELMVLSPDVDDRARLKQAAVTEKIFKQVKVAATAREVVTRLGSGDGTDILLIGCDIAEDELQRFVVEVKSGSKDRPVVPILLLNQSDQSKELLESFQRIGIEGFLFAPYSPEDFKPLIKLAKEIRAQGELERENNRYRTKLRGYLRLLDLTVAKKAYEMDWMADQEMFREAVKEIGSFPAHIKSRLPELLSDVCEHAAPLPPPYDGPSERLKQKFIDKVLADIEKAGA